jgi:dTDP-4-dehydrorhamnose reductase
VEKKTILITGASGQLGQELAVEAHRPPPPPHRTSAAPAPASQIDAATPPEARNSPPDAAASQLAPLHFVFADRLHLPIDDAAAVSRFFRDHQPAWCINCAAYTAVDKAETEKEKAFQINAEAVANLASACRDAGTRLIHLSTDYVFDGNSAIPLKETDPPSPINVYGASKLRGEEEALALHPDGTLVIRTSWVYSEFGHNFVKTMIRLMKERTSISVVNDQIGSPTYAADLARAILQIIYATNYPSSATTRPSNSTPFRPGIYNYSNEGEISWYEFALAIRELIGSQCQVQPIPSSQFPTPARRPHYSLLDKSLIRNTYGLTIPGWRESLAVCVEKLK